MDNNNTPTKKQVLLYLRQNSKGCGLMLASNCLDKFLYMLKHMPNDVCDMYPDLEMKWVMKASKRQHATD